MVVIILLRSASDILTAESHECQIRYFPAMAKEHRLEYRFNGAHYVLLHACLCTVQCPTGSQMSNWLSAVPLIAFGFMVKK
mmetsp:Transcript_2562/g.5838  ORF Transcript_2562/g.5838 Transcript_2562/m.5838 type:complete len:81 (-) Transcript_2562:66-308(-)